MTKMEIARAVYKGVGGLSLKESAEVVEQVFETMKEMLGRGEKVRLKGFGSFVLRDKRARRSRDPQTGKTITILARRVLTFKDSPALRLALNPRNGAPPTASRAHDVAES